MAEEITNNQAPLTARQVAAQNPELDKLRQISFGENYLDDIDAGTGTARFYSGFGQQPTYTGTNTDQSVADAVTAQAEAVAAPDQSGGQDQVTGGLTDNTPFEQNLIDEGAGVQIAPGQPVVAPGEIPITQQEIDEYNLNTPFEQNLINQGVGVQTQPGAPVGAQGERFDDSPLSVSQQADIASQTNFGLDYNQLDQEGQREIDEQIKATPNITPATDFNLLGTAANLITGGITNIPFVGTAVQKATDFFKGGGNDSVASETDFSTMGDSSVDAFENDPNNIENIENIQTPLETAIGINQIDYPEVTGDDETISGDTVTETTDPIGDFEVSGGVGKPGEVLDTFLGPVASTPTETYYDGGSETDTSAGVDAGTADVQDFADIAPTPSQPDQRDRGGGGGGGGGGGKIVCTMMNDTYGFGNFRNKIWLRQSKDLAPEYQKGYHKIFLPLVRLSKTNIIVRKILEHIAVHRTIDIRQETRGKRHILGRVYRKVLEPICYLVGKYGKR